jgi:D-alanyl-D-alanine carboxypeptidase/D-alanyl-D-alanine-endopeptidase (penicillin-binding protein 4)
LAIAALVPALALGGCWRFADGKVPTRVALAPSSTVAGSGGSIGTSDLQTPLLSVRRSPAVLARDVNLAAFAAIAGKFLPNIDGTSCVAVSVDGQQVAAKNADKPLRPASNVKVITASVALQVLGPGFTYSTDVRGSLQNGVVQGDLYLIGGGDPLLTSDWWRGPSTKYPPFNTTSVEALAASIHSAGVTRITGSVIGDASRYDDEWYAPSWTKDVRFTEGGPISALLANDSRESNSVSSNDPVVGAATVLTQALRDAGVQVSGKPSKRTAPTDLPIVASIASKPLPAVLQEMLTTSDNNTAEMILKEIGLKVGGKGTREAGLAAVIDQMKAWNVPMDGVSLVDGSGLSDDNRLTCNALLAVLDHQSVDGPVGQGMATAGQDGGTLSDAFVGTKLEGKLRGKTGTLYNYNDGTGGKPSAKALTGWLPLDGGGAIEFTMLLNGPQIAEKTNYRPIWDAFATMLLGYPTGPTAGTLGPRS